MSGGANQSRPPCRSQCPSWAELAPHREGNSSVGWLPKSRQRGRPNQISAWGRTRSQNNPEISFPLVQIWGGGTWEVETACLPPPQILNVGELLLYPLISTPDGVTHSQRHTSSAQGSLPAGPGDPLGCQRHSPGGLSAKKCPPHCAYLSLDAPFCRFMCKIVPLGSM